MIPEKSTFSCHIQWQGRNEDYDSFRRIHQIILPGGATVMGGAAHNVQDPAQTNPEELFAAAVGTCMMLTILAVFSRSKVLVTAYDDQPEALLELVERRYRVTKVTLRPKITVQGEIDEAKFASLIQKSHANCFVTLSVNSAVVVEPAYISG